MRTVKLTNKLLKLLPDGLLIALGAVEPAEKGSTRQRSAFPSHVYMSPKDYKKMKANALSYAKKELKLSKRSADLSVEMEFLNYGANESEGVKPGFVMINDESIAAEIERLAKAQENE